MKPGRPVQMAFDDVKALWHQATPTVQEVEPDVEQDLMDIEDDVEDHVQNDAE